MAISDIDLGKWLGTMYEDYTAGRAQKESMFGKGVGALESYADIFRPGGAYGAGVETMIGRGEKKAVASGMQNLVSAGLANTTMPMHLQQTFQEEVGMPTRMQAEDVRMTHLGGALGSLGQMYAGYDPGTASAGDIAHMATGGFGTLMGGRIANQQARLEASRQTAENQAGLQSQRMWDEPSSGGGSSGGGTAPTTSLHSGGLTEPYGGGFGSGGVGSVGTGGSMGEFDVDALLAEGYTLFPAGGERMIPGTEIPFGKNVSRNAATGIESQLIAAGYTYDKDRGTYMAPTSGGAGDIGSTISLQDLAAKGLEWMYQ